MKIGIMQPYLFPYIGYWQLFNTVDRFVIYDNIEFTKNSWIRRNRFLMNGSDKMFSLPIKKDSDYLDINQRFLADDAEKECKKILNQIQMSYKKAPHFAEVYPLLESCFLYPEKNLFDYILHSIRKTAEYLGIQTEIVVSSTIPMDHSLKNKHRVMETCLQLGGDHYVNPIGGTGLYDKAEFEAVGLKLNFLRTTVQPYPQFRHEFVPSLSIIDVMMFNSVEEIQQMLQEFELI